MYLAIDPGACSGWALFTVDRCLLRCGISEPPHSLPPDLHIAQVLVEHPRIYPGGRTKNPNDILTLAITAGEWAGRFKGRGVHVDYVEPQRWKGKVKKAIHQLRVVDALHTAERTIAFAECKRIAPKWTPAKIGTGPEGANWRNLLDAIGLGLFMVGR